MRKYSEDDYRGQGYPVLTFARPAYVSDAARERAVRRADRWVRARPARDVAEMPQWMAANLAMAVR